MPAAHRCRNSRTGLTLVEIIVVVVILGILAAMIVPAATRGKDIEVNSAAQILATDLDYARNVAITYQRGVTVTFDVAAGTYQLAWADDGSLLQRPVEKDDFICNFAQRSGTEDVEIVSANFQGTTSLTFDDRGEPDRGGKVKLMAGDYKYEITIAPVTGAVTVKDTTGTP